MKVPGVGVLVGGSVFHGIGVGVKVWVLVGVGVGEAVAVGVTVGVRVGVELGVLVGVRVGVAVGDEVGVTLGLTVGVGRGELSPRAASRHHLAALDSIDLADFLVKFFNSAVSFPCLHEPSPR